MNRDVIGRGNTAQTILGYALLIILVAFVFIAMQIYMTRGIQDKYRQSADVFGQGEQYAPGVTIVSENLTLPDGE